MLVDADVWSTVFIVGGVPSVWGSDEDVDILVVGVVDRESVVLELVAAGSLGVGKATASSCDGFVSSVDILLILHGG